MAARRTLLDPRDLLTFASEAAKYRRQHPGTLRILDLLRGYRPWHRTQRTTAFSLQDPLPWLPFSAISMLERILEPDARVFEYGSGGSTLFFAQRVQQVFSVEHNRDWWVETTQVLTERGCRNAEVRLIEPEPESKAASADAADPSAYISSDKHFATHSWKAYAGAIDTFPADHFDVVVIDGRVRPSCFQHAVSRVRPEGYLVLDNAERPHYRSIHSAMERAGWQAWYCHGPVPFIPQFSQTAFWQCPRAKRAP